MKPMRRALLAVVTAGVVAGVLRLRGSAAGGGTQPRRGGWRELSGPDLR